MAASHDPPASLNGQASVRLCVLLWARTGADGALIDYEDRVLELMEDHGARVLQRARTDGADGAPLEIQILEYPSQAALDGYLADERRAALAGERDAAIARTEILPVELV
jgi:uncharacterized protein (DUF1330 family)